MFGQRRKNSLRKINYDYSKPGQYFITFNTFQRKKILGKIINGKMSLNQYGEIIKDTWLDLPNHNFNIILDEFIIMPDHFHGIIEIIDPHGRIPDPPGIQDPPGIPDLPEIPDLPKIPDQAIKRRNSVPPQHNLSEIIRQLKSFSTRRINELRGTPGARVWHRSFNDKIIRSKTQLDNTRNYIKNNPQKGHDTTLK